MTTFTAETYQNEYLAVGATQVDALVSVSASGSGAPAATGPAAAEIVIIDVSGSMNSPRAKIRSAIAATIAAIDCIRDGVLFAVIAGTDEAHQLYPFEKTLVPASPTTRAHAADIVRRLKAGGGTAMGSWLRAANELFVDSPRGIRHAILLTDGENQNETEDELADALAECDGNFQCDCRGIGADWMPSELKKIASTLLGTVEAIRRPEDMAADFTATMQRAMGKTTSDVALRLWTPVNAAVTLVQQVSPSIEDLTLRRAPVINRDGDVSELEGDYPTGAWGDESRDYHVSIHVPARDVGAEMAAGRVKLVVNGEVLSEAKILAIWTSDDARSTRVNAQLAHFTGQEEIAVAIDEAFEARRAGDDDTATKKLGRAVQLASEMGDTFRLQQLSRMVDIVDAPTGKVQPKADVDALDEIEIEVGSTKTTRLPKPPS